MKDDFKQLPWYGTKWWHKYLVERDDGKLYCELRASDVFKVFNEWPLTSEAVREFMNREPPS
jgi:hypothetical protein